MVNLWLIMVNNWNNNSITGWCFGPFLRLSIWIGVMSDVIPTDELTPSFFRGVGRKTTNQISNEFLTFNNPHVWSLSQWEFQDPKMEVLYHIRPYFGGMPPYIGLIYGRYLHFRILKFPLIIVVLFWARGYGNFQSLARGSLVQVTGVQLDIVSRKSQRQSEDMAWASSRVSYFHIYI